MTLLELMITMSILGVMVTVAIPAFKNYKLNSKRAEAFSNLSAIAKAEKARYAEFGTYAEALAEPMNSGLGPDPKRHDSSSVEAEFATIGWAPEGSVYYSYDVVTDGSAGASCPGCSGNCFTATAYGDLDGNGETSVVMYAQSDVQGNFCNVWLMSNVSPPTNNGSWMLNTVAKVPAFDTAVEGEFGVDDY